VVKLLIGILACYLLLVAAAYLFQRRMLYFPSTATRGQMAEVASQRGLALWPDDTDAYQGLVSTQPLAPAKGTVLVWHGNGGSAVHRAYYVYALERLGFRVILLEYPGYGARPGRPGESLFVRDGLQAARRATETFGGPLYVWGESLGGGIASAVAGDPALDVRGAVMMTPWDRLPDLAQRLYPYLPARWLVRDRYNNVQNLRAFSGRVAVLMAGQDEVIPNRHTMRLYESLESEKRLWVFPGAGHNSWPMASDAAWWAEVMGWVSGPS
jgi:alpha-beta hydrolase superfamily lysophospholipase